VETIYIENFAGIKKMDFDFKSINILIGPQGSGKSVTVKLMYFFKNFINEIVKNIENEESKRDLDKNQKEIFLNFFPKETWPKDDFLIVYKNNITSISLKKVDSKIIFEYSENLKKLLKKGKKIYTSEKAKYANDHKISNFRFKRELSDKIKKCIQEELGVESTFEQFFIPAGRSFFANIQSTIFSFLSDNRSLDPFLIEFGSFYESLKRYYNDIIVNNNSPQRQDKEFDELTSQILSSNYLREKEKDYLIHKDSRKVNLTNASSGQQETLPLIIILKALNYISSSGGGFTLYIEEPEAHLFPTAQKRIVELLARTFNSKNRNFQIFITTHSPYILSSFNNLIYAGNLAENIKYSTRVEEVISPKEYLESYLFSVYSLRNNVRSYLIDEETKLITTTILDSVSDDISIEFDKLLNIEFNDL
jgi:predicted ATP-dependent endonuclease of OLD family